MQSLTDAERAALKIKLDILSRIARGEGESALALRALRAEIVAKQAEIVAAQAANDATLVDELAYQLSELVSTCDDFEKRIVALEKRRPVMAYAPGGGGGVTVVESTEKRSSYMPSGW